MCDESTMRDDAMVVTRRTFSAAAGVLAAWPGMLSAKATAQLTERDVMIETPDGSADGYFVHPARGKHPAVLVWPDIWGVRPAFRDMAKRLASAGFAVLVVNPFYRSAKAPVLPPEKKSTPEGLAIVRPYAARLSRTVIESDARAFAAFLDRQRAVDTGRPMATTGYCMGGPIVMVTAAALPGRIGAAASFHGGGLATDKPDSPHLLIPAMKAQFLAAVAENDDQKTPQEKEMLRTAFAAAGLPAEIEVYAGALHGWCPPDSRVYNEAQAERAWSRMLALFERALGPTPKPRPK
jgi:carboxymethylenebutenolidase